MGMGSTNLVQLMRALNGVPRRLGTITTTSAAAKDNASTAVPFTTRQRRAGHGAGRRRLLRRGRRERRCARPATSGVKVLADATYVMRMASDLPVLSVIRASADVNVKVWKLR
jgi:hypothetical protein